MLTEKGARDPPSPRTSSAVSPGRRPRIGSERWTCAESTSSRSCTSRSFTRGPGPRRRAHETSGHQGGETTKPRADGVHQSYRPHDHLVGTEQRVWVTDVAKDGTSLVGHPNRTRGCSSRVEPRTARNSWDEAPWCASSPRMARRRRSVGGVGAKRAEARSATGRGGGDGEDGAARKGREDGNDGRRRQSVRRESRRRSSRRANGKKRKRDDDDDDEREWVCDVRGGGTVRRRGWRERGDDGGWIDEARGGVGGWRARGAPRDPPRRDWSARLLRDSSDRAPRTRDSNERTVRLTPSPSRGSDQS